MPARAGPGAQGRGARAIGDTRQCLRRARARALERTSLFSAAWANAADTWTASCNLRHAPVSDATAVAGDGRVAVKAARAPLVAHSGRATNQPLRRGPITTVWRGGARGASRERDWGARFSPLHCRSGGSAARSTAARAPAGVTRRASRAGQRGAAARPLRRRRRRRRRCALRSAPPGPGPCCSGSEPTGRFQRRCWRRHCERPSWTRPTGLGTPRQAPRRRRRPAASPQPGRADACRRVTARELRGACRRNPRVACVCAATQCDAGNGGRFCAPPEEYGCTGASPDGLLLLRATPGGPGGYGLRRPRAPEPPATFHPATRGGLAGRLARSTHGRGGCVTRSLVRGSEASIVTAGTGGPHREHAISVCLPCPPPAQPCACRGHPGGAWRCPAARRLPRLPWPD